MYLAPLFGPKPTTVASGRPSTPSPYPTSAGPLAQFVFTNPSPVQADPRFSPVSRYRQTEPAATNVTLVVKPATTVTLTGAEVRLAPPSSLATAVKFQEPAR